MVRESPILFNNDMVQAILDGRKTNTRRTVKLPYFVIGDETDPGTIMAMRTAPKGSRLFRQIGHMPYGDAPYKPGDILYVRETWNFIPCIECCVKNCNNIPVSHEDSEMAGEGCFIYRAGYTQKERICWKPSIHMPKAAARIWLRVTDVRVERLHDMTLDGFLSEGIYVRPEAFNDPENAYLQAKEIFVQVWNSTIKAKDLDIYGYDANPWVWVIEFERCEKPESEWQHG